MKQKQPATELVRRFYRWTKDWESLQRQEEPELLNSVLEKICRDLCLAMYSSAEDIFRVLQDLVYSNKPPTAMEIIEDLGRVPPLELNRPRRLTVENLTELGSIKVIKNTRWLGSNHDTPENHFDSLLKYLKGEEGIPPCRQEGAKEDVSLERKCASTMSARRVGCMVCGDERHRQKSFFCKQFKELESSEKLKALGKLGA